MRQIASKEKRKVSVELPPCQHVKVLVRFLVPTNSIKYNRSQQPSTLPRRPLETERARTNASRFGARKRSCVCAYHIAAFEKTKTEQLLFMFSLPHICYCTCRQHKKCEWCNRRALNTDTNAAHTLQTGCLLGSLLTEQHCVVFSQDEKVVTGEITTNRDVGGRQ